MNTLSKLERLYKQKQIEELFLNDSPSFIVFPLRIVYLPSNDLKVRASILISVSKRHFKHAVKRNKIKRQIREAYRLNKNILDFSEDNNHWLIAFIYLSNDLVNSSVIKGCVRKALYKIIEK